MSIYLAEELHRLVLASIDREVVVGLVSGDKACGCHQRPRGSDRWWLCPHHVGMQDGIDLFLADLEESLFSDAGFGRTDRPDD